MLIFLSLYPNKVNILILLYLRFHFYIHILLISSQVFIIFIYLNNMYFQLFNLS